MEFSIPRYSRSGKKAKAQCCFISVEMPSSGEGLPYLIFSRMPLSTRSTALQDKKWRQGKFGEWHHFRIVLDFKDRTYDFYVDDEQVADDFGFRGEGGKGGVNPSLSWIFFGWDHPTALTNYIDDIEMGDGEGRNGWQTAIGFRLRQTRDHLRKNQAAIVASVHATVKVCQLTVAICNQRQFRIEQFILR